MKTRSWHQASLLRHGVGSFGFAGKTSHVPEQVEGDEQPDETLRQGAPTFLGLW